ncbi:SeqA protein, negative modulator of initiation of replication [Moritella sp. JT01]|uniref:replication initiation negative regulator SeqA n=1 Tax=Moritella sp. JT01 TaxID=756698 RepID=UPI0007924098|nr:replication initiation negative regulator SeqA [Moritella sp. JT01]KXO07878.1 SeqA protein, negative modulator of initiation of replication [Moritella sp. JT01]
MKTIELEDDLYRYIASQTKDIGESASDILRRLLGVPDSDCADLTNVEALPQPVENINSETKQTVTNSPAVVEPTPVSAPIVVEPEVVSHSTLPASIDKLIKNKKFKETTVSVTKFIQILSVLYAENPKKFDSATDIKGRKRIYFAKSESELLSAGSTTKPRHIENTPYWVITNTNTGRKRNIITQLMAEIGYTHALIDAVSQSI